MAPEELLSITRRRYLPYLPNSPQNTPLHPSPGEGSTSLGPKVKETSEPEFASSKKPLKSTRGRMSAARGMWHKCGCRLGVGGFADRAGKRDWTNAHRTVNTATARAQPLSSDAREVCTNRIDGK